ncbi:fimbrial protein [Pantoea sp. Lu_F5_004]|uniref:fimbrial protein n=1 Tax=Pantoea sp. Lu_F5_004 TaxID=3443507 RepID=UPI003EBDCCA9
MKKIIQLIVYSCALLFIQVGTTKAAVCSNIKGTPDNINYDITQNLSASNNQAGYIFNIVKNAGSYIGVKAICPAGVGVRYTYRSYISPHPIIDKDGNYQYVKLNDYLNAGISIKDSYAGTYYPPVNYVHMGNDSNVSKNKPFAVEDSDLDFHFKLTRPFVGSVNYSLTPAFYVYVTTTNTDALEKVVYTISYSGKMIVPQSCELNAGQIITMDFGNIAASAFSQAGAGNKPAGVNPQTRSIGIKCKNIDAQALLSLRIEANKVTGNALVSDNPDLGFVIANGKYNPLTPNSIDSNIPFKLDESASANVPISAWPVSVTGKKPVEGRFTSEGYLRVDFD